MNQHDKFKVFINADIVKGNSEGEMRIRGIASDNNKDRQGEYLDPSTMDLSDFSWINWNHKGKDDPSTIIGEPDKSKVRVTENNELYIEGVLYPNVPMAKATFNLMNALQKSPSGKRLGMSVEGMVMERDPMDPNKITKSKITGVAICPVPVNGATWTELIQKGFTDETELVYDKETKEFLNEIEKAISIEGTTGSLEETGVDRKIEKESVEGTVKKKKKKLKEVIDPENKEEIKEEKSSLTKSEVYEKIFNYFYINDLQKAKNVFNIITKISQMDKKEITDETIAKAMSILDLAEGKVEVERVEETSSTEIEKSEDVVLEPIAEVIETPQVEEVEKAFNAEAKGKSKEEDVEENKEEKSDKKDKPKFKDSLYKACKDDADDMVKEGKNKEEIEKALVDGGYSQSLAQVVCQDITIASDKAANEGTIATSSIQKSEIEDLMKSQVSELSEIIKSHNSVFSDKLTPIENTIKVQENRLDELTKAFNTIIDENKALKERLQTVEKTPVGAKSIISKSFVDRFEQAAPQANTYNLNSKMDRVNLIEKAFDLGMTKGDDALVNAALNLESTGQLTPQNITKLASVGFNVI